METAPLCRPDAWSLEEGGGEKGGKAVRTAGARRTKQNTCKIREPKHLRMMMVVVVMVMSMMMAWL